MRQRVVAGATSLILSLVAAAVALGSGGPSVADARLSPVLPAVEVSTLPAEPSPQPSTTSTPSPTQAATQAPRHAPPDEPPDEPPPPPLPPPPPPPPPPANPATSPEEAVAFAYAAGMQPGRFQQVGVALYDRQEGILYGAGLDNRFASASVFKVFVAAKLLHDHVTLSGYDWDQMWRMIVNSDNDALNYLRNNLAGGTQAVIDWVRAVYGVNVGQPSPRFAWGFTQITARGMVDFYRRAYADDAVRPWLFDAMAHATSTGGTGWGLPQAAASWAVKQGWTCCSAGGVIHSTGYVEGGRYIAVILTRSSDYVYYHAGSSYVTAMARALLPGGHVPVPAPPSPSPDPSPTPSTQPSASTQPSPSAQVSPSTQPESSAEPSNPEPSLPA